MLRSRVIPTLLIQNNRLVKTTKFKKPIYIGDPINAVKIFNDKEVDELILLDISKTVDNLEPDYRKLEEIVTEAFMPIGYGGGIKSLNQIERIFTIGMEKVILNSSLYDNPDMILKAVQTFGAQSIVASIDIKKNLRGKYIPVSRSNRKKEKIDLKDLLVKIQGYGIGEIYINSVDRDGTMLGYDLELIQLVNKSASVPVICAGGAAKIEDFAEAINQTGVSAVSAGAMFVFNGVHRAVLISYPEYSELEKRLN